MSVQTVKDAITAARVAISDNAENARRLTVDAIVAAYNARLFRAASNLLQHAVTQGTIPQSSRRSPLETCTRFNCICPGGANVTDRGICWTYSHAHNAESSHEEDDAPTNAEQDVLETVDTLELGHGAGAPAPPALPGASGSASYPN